MDSREAPFLQHLREIFRVEAADHVQGISSGLLALEKAPEADRATLVEKVFREAHSLKGAARAVDDREVERLSQAMEDELARWRRGEAEPTPELLDQMHASVDAVAAALAPPSATPPPASAPTFAALASVPSPAIAVDRGAGTPADSVRVPVSKLENCLAQAEELTSAKQTSAQRAADVRALADGLAQWDRTWAELQPQLRQARARPSQDPDTWEKLLAFVDWNADFVKDVVRRAEVLEQQMRLDAHQAERLVDDLLEDSKLLLLLPFSAITGSFARLVRELCRDQGKQADLRIHGEDIELDKRVLEEVKDPLIHLLRNSVDHGIESPAQRRAAGKPETGTITLEVSQLGAGKVRIAVTDDGAGIDASRVLDAAIARGLLDPGEAASLGKEDAYALVFASDLSTRETVTALSGRGLGLAIVKEKALKLGGNAWVTSDPGRGTAFRIEVPATQATFRGIQVIAAGQLLVLPTLQVERVVRVNRAQVHSLEQREAFTLEDRPVSLVHLADLLELAPAGERDATGDDIEVLVLGHGEQRIGFAVDRVVGEQEVVVKRLRRPLVRVRNVAGATVLGSGQVAPVLDVADLLKSARRAGASPRFTTPAPAPQRARILVAEDSITSRLLLKGILEGAGYGVRTAPDGLEAFALLRQHRFDLLVSDVEMPGINGFELAMRVRAEDRLKEVPIILVTALETPRDRERGLDAGANAYLVKSNFDQSDLLATIERLL
jgi:two-component system chemotaxis sensor kinase CheA